MSDTISLIEIPAKLRAHGIETTYHLIWRKAVEGKIPAHRRGSRWFVAASDVPRIVETFTPAGQ